MRLRVLIGVAVALSATGCGGPADDETPAAAAAATSSGVAETTAASDPAATETDPSQGGAHENATTHVQSTTDTDRTPVEGTSIPEEFVPATSTAAPSIGEVNSDLMAEIRRDLVSRTGAAESDIVVVRSEEVIWNDGSLGCAEPGEIYTQALVNGYWVVLEHNGQTYDYRATDTGYFRLCEGFGAPPSNPTG